MIRIRPGEGGVSIFILWMSNARGTVESSPELKFSRRVDVFTPFGLIVTRK